MRNLSKRILHITSAQAASRLVLTHSTHTYEGMSGGGRLAGMFPTGVGLGAMRWGTDGTALEGATGAARCGTD